MPGQGSARTPSTGTSRHRPSRPSDTSQATAIKPNHVAAPMTTATIEYGSSRRNWPKTRAPRATLAASGSLSISSSRRRFGKRSIVATWCEWRARRKAPTIRTDSRSMQFLPTLRSTALAETAARKRLVLPSASMVRAVKRLLRWLGLLRGPLPPGSPRDPYAWKPAPVRPRPKSRSGAVAVAEPDE